jgi:two-component system phosphate regulon sensor histidine kinase PhoR
MFHQLRWRITIPIVSLLLGVTAILLFTLRLSLSTTEIWIWLALAGVLSVLVSAWIDNWVASPIKTLTEVIKNEQPNWAIPGSYTDIDELAIAIKVKQDQLRSDIANLEQSLGQQSVILSEMSDGVILVDERGDVQLVNPAARNLFGVSETDVIGRSLIVAFRQHQLVEIWQESRSTNQTETVTLDLLSRKLYLQCVATPLVDTRPRNTLILLTDLTRLRQLETIRQDFIHNISHELRTPLASLKALTETLIDGAMDDPPAARKFLLSMETEVDTLSLMVSELLELSRIESGRVPLKLHAISPCELVNRAVERLYLQADRAGLIIDTDCDPSITPVLADASRLEQVLVNLLHNAIKFTPQGGRIVIKATLEQELIKFSVQDNGSGIPAIDLPRIFERFFKSDRARRGGGTGLGLAISRHLVEAHGGKIWAESIEGQGSTFTFTIPIAT